MEWNPDGLGGDYHRVRRAAFFVTAWLGGGCGAGPEFVLERIASDTLDGSWSDLDCADARRSTTGASTPARLLEQPQTRLAFDLTRRFARSGTAADEPHARDEEEAEPHFHSFMHAASI